MDFEVQGFRDLRGLGMQGLGVKGRCRDLGVPRSFGIFGG